LPNNAARRWILGVAATAPIVAVTIGVLVFAAIEAGGRTPWSPGPLRNIAEAAGTGEASEVIRMLREAQDPNALWTVRPEIISSSVTRVTALEAAVWSRRAQQMELLDREGAIKDADTRRYLACLAADLRVDEIVEYLSPAAPPECLPGETLKGVQARSAPQ
jgi:hypothetical protein